MLLRNIVLFFLVSVIKPAKENKTERMEVEFTSRLALHKRFVVCVIAVALYVCMNQLLFHSLDLSVRFRDKYGPARHPLAQ